MNGQEIVLSSDLKQELDAVIAKGAYDKVFVLGDENTLLHCLPLLEGTGRWNSFNIISIGAGEQHKRLDVLESVCRELSDNGATRHSLLVNLGGGMVTDLGGFAASVFKRGIRFIHIPTTLLGMVDAAIGGKNGVNFNGLKNELGTFTPATAVLVETKFLRTLDRENFLSGYAEMLKHGLISDVNTWADVLNFDLAQMDYDRLRQMVGQSIRIKQEIVAADPYERGIRKALNLGHTVGHALESLAMSQGNPVSHGYTVAWGMVCELYYSHIKTGFPKDKLRQTIQFIRQNYGVCYIDCNRYEAIYDRMKHDKKNKGDEINFTLLENIGKVKIDQVARKEDIYDMLDFYRECMGI